MIPRRAFKALLATGAVLLIAACGSPPWFTEEPDLVDASDQADYATAVAGASLRRNDATDDAHVGDNRSTPAARTWPTDD